MKIIVPFLIVCACAAGCSHDNGVGYGSTTAPAGTTSGAAAGPTSTNENAMQGNVHIVHSPSEIPPGTTEAYKIVPKDPSQFPSNAAGGDH